LGGEEGESRREQVRTLGQTEGPVERLGLEGRGRAEEERAIVDDDERQSGCLGSGPFGADGGAMRGPEPRQRRRRARRSHRIAHGRHRTLGG